MGAGLFGITAALALDEAGCSVTLVERRRDILQGATAASMNRVHLGYHYPRSRETIASVRKAERAFRAQYGSAVIDDFLHLYMIAGAGSLTTSEQFAQVCAESGLPYRRADLPQVKAGTVDSIIEVDEGTIDPEALRLLCEERLARSQVELRLCTSGVDVRRSDYDHVVLATYADPAGDVLGARGAGVDHLRFDLCEVMVAELPVPYRNLSIVLLDGPFFSIDPLGRTGLSLLYHVVHSVHLRANGRDLELPGWAVPLLDAGPVSVPDRSNFAKVVEHASYFLHGFERAEYAHSLFALRAVRRDVSDARLTTVTRVADSVTEVFSGKLVNCTSAAEAVVAAVVAET